MEQLTKNKIDEILARKPESRYKYFIRTVAELEEVWGMADEEGWIRSLYKSDAADEK